MRRKAIWKFAKKVFKWKVQGVSHQNDEADPGQQVEEEIPPKGSLVAQADQSLCWTHMSRFMRKPFFFFICENKDVEQLRCDREADQRLCFRYMDSTIPLLSKPEISSL